VSWANQFGPYAVLWAIFVTLLFAILEERPRLFCRGQSGSPSRSAPRAAPNEVSAKIANSMLECAILTPATKNFALKHNLQTLTGTRYDKRFPGGSPYTNYESYETCVTT
jgi:hypothetical protein